MRTHFQTSTKLKIPKDQQYDLAIIGGGINGAGIARDAAGRGMSVFLADKGDFGGATSAASSKLIHGGLRYLETYEFSLVQESLQERQTLMTIVPHLVTPLTFLIPITKDQKRPTWFVRLGLWFYDMLAGSARLGWSGQLSKIQRDALPRLCKDNLKTVLKYQDCQTDDNGLVLATLLDAQHLGADIFNYTAISHIEALSCKSVSGMAGFAITYQRNGMVQHKITARHVVNVAGPWVNHVNDRVNGLEVKRHSLKLVRGSHLIVAMPKMADEAAYTLQNKDGRIIFTIPWLKNRYLLIGTTDEVQDSPDKTPECSKAERDYLLKSYNRYFPAFPLSKEDIIDSFAGLRPLADNGAAKPSKVTRDFTLAQTQHGDGRYICVYGGKLTTHRVLAEKVLALIPEQEVQFQQGWTKEAIMTQSPVSQKEVDALIKKGSAKIAESIRTRWVMRYGWGCTKIYGLYAQEGGDLEIAQGVFEAELLYVCYYQYCQTAEDFLGHRSWLKLSLSQSDIEKVKQWFEVFYTDKNVKQRDS